MRQQSQSAGAGLGLWPAIALVVGHTIGVGIFLTPAQLIGAVASPALTLGLWVICGALVFCGALTFGELASRYPLAGGPYIYLKEGWGERIAFLYGWQSLLILDPGITAALATGASAYLILLWPSAAGAERWIAIGVIWVLAALSMAGLMLSARVLTVMTMFKLLAFLAVVLLAFAAAGGSWSHLEPFVTRHSAKVPLGEALALGFVSVFFSFGGFWEASRIANEVRNPRQTLAVALAVGVTCVTAVYVALTIAFMYIVPLQEVTSAPDFARRAGEAMLGSRGPSVLASIVVLSVVASLLALLIMAPRLYVAMSLDRLFPASIASINQATQAPVRPTALLAALASLFVLVGTFQAIVAFFMCTTLCFIALAAGALIAIRRRVPSDRAPFQSSGYPVTPILFILLVVAIVALIAINRPLQAVAGLTLVLLGIPAYGIFVKSHARGEQASTWLP
jgi:basic amino acid/polyamine antiporter, APA family